MATILRMPDLGTVEGQVTLVRWLKAEGDMVAIGEPLFEVETDKGVSEVEAALAGVLVRKVLSEGQKAGPGETVAYIRRPGESDEMPGAATAPTVQHAAPAAAGAPAAPTTPAVPTAPATAPAATGPVIRALAAKRGVDLAKVKPTGPGGRITRQDVLQARGSAPAAATLPFSAPAAGPLTLSQGQLIVARRVSESHREKPVYRVVARVDMSRAIAFRAQAKVSWDALFVRTAAIVVEEMPLFRRWLRGQEVAEHPAADVALAVGVGEDLFIPAVRGAARADVPEVSARIEALVKKAQGRALVPAEVEGSCFLVSNLGMFPIESFDAIIYPEHSAALAVGAVTPTVVSDGQKIWSAPMAHLTLSVDHRLVNGKVAATFLSRVKEILEKGEFA